MLSSLIIILGHILLRFVIYGNERYIQREIGNKTSGFGVAFGLIMWLAMLVLYFGMSDFDDFDNAIEFLIVLMWFPLVCFVRALYVRIKYPIIPNYMPPEEPEKTPESKRQEIIEQVESDGNWVCKHCGTINAKNVLYCKDCGEHK